jgi:hypothetical protein
MSECPGQYDYHYEDNQGLCHSCGMPINFDSWFAYEGGDREAMYEQWNKLVADHAPRRHRND